ncbi:MAG: DNA primase, partial [Patescibacteria group bacterium]|nr:DNA primase [Patescibacteria group bacterium]
MINSPVEEIKNRLDIVEVIGNYIKIEKAGINYRALCPFHSEKKPSFFISPTRQTWRCFGACGEGGDMFSFVMKIEGIEFGDALRLLARKAGVELKREDPKLKTERQRLYEISELSCRFFETQLQESEKGKKAKNYLLSRGIKEESIKKWRLGYAPDTWQGLSDFLVGRGYKREEIEKVGLVLKSEKTKNYYDRFRARIMFPIFNLSSSVIAFGGRIIENQDPNSKDKPYDETAKYINSPATILYDKSNVLYGLEKAGIGIRRKDQCVLVEGYMDVIMSHQAGVENTVSTSGTALTGFQLKNLKRYSNNLLTAFDMDLAGGSATKKGIDLAQSLGFDIRVVVMPEGSDPADIVFENAKKWEDLIKNAKSIHDFYFQDALSKYDKNSLEGKKQISEFLLPVIKKIPNRIEKSFWIKSLANLLETREEDIIEEIEKNKYSSSERIKSFEKPVEPTDKAKTVREKNRKGLLEEQLIILIIKSPENLDLLKEEDFELLSSETSEIIQRFKEQGFDLKDVDSEMDKLIDYLSLKAEVQSLLDKGSAIEKFEEDFKKEEMQEFENCLKELKILAFKDNLNSISKDIKESEKNENFDRVKELV